MKTVLIAASILVSPLFAFAQPISLQPGSTVVINGDVVSCNGPATDQLPVCSIRQDAGFYRLLSGNTVVESFYSFNDAIAGAKKLKDAGLCK